MGEITLFGQSISLATLIFLSVFIIFIILFGLFKDKIQKQQGTIVEVKYPLIEVTKEQVRDAIRKYSDTLPKGVYRTILVKEDYSIDFEKLAPILKGLPSKPFYMSKETYDVFEEDGKHVPLVMDKIQKAVDAYVQVHQKFPILDFDPDRRVNYFLLRNERYIDFQPDLEFYITEYDGIITHQKPEKMKG